MIESDEPSRDLSALALPQLGALRENGDPFEPYRLLDASGRVVAPAAAYLRELQARGLPGTTQRSYGMALLRWFRFLGAIEVPWEQATRVEARDFSRWVQVAAKPVRAHWRHRDQSVAVSQPTPAKAQGSPNPVTGKAPPGANYAPATVAHSESVLRGFYEFHLEAGSGPMVNRSRCPGCVVAGGRTPTTIRWSRSGMIAADCIGRVWCSGRPGRFPTRSSTSCSPRSARTATGPWWRFGCRRVRGHRSCSAWPAGTPTRASS